MESLPLGRRDVFPCLRYRPDVDRLLQRLMFIPAAWGLLLYLITPTTITSQNMSELIELLKSVLFTWGVLWLLRGLVSCLIHRQLPWGEKEPKTS